MRIIHDVDAPMVVGEVLSSVGRAELHAFTDCASNHPHLHKRMFDAEMK
jgi:hypothetical protein